MHINVGNLIICKGLSAEYSLHAAYTKQQRALEFQKGVITKIFSDIQHPQFLVYWFSYGNIMINKLPNEYLRLPQETVVSLKGLKLVWEDVQTFQ